jgi:BMFP domain-containing protein YqiC
MPFKPVLAAPLCPVRRTTQPCYSGVRQAFELLKGDAMSAGGSRILDDLGRLMTDAAGVASGVRREIDGIVKSQIERLLRDADVVTREEFEAVREMAVMARDENDALKSRIVALEAKLAGEEKPAKKAKATG